LSQNLFLRDDDSYLRAEKGFKRSHRFGQLSIIEETFCFYRVEKVNAEERTGVSL
jgi:hypothetical protein